MVTPFGKTVRKLRIDRGLKLKDMADALGVKSAYLSAVETGKKRITDKILKEITDYFNDVSIKENLTALVDQSQPDCNIDLRDKDDNDRELVVAFARKFSDLGPESKGAIQRLLDMK